MTVPGSDIDHAPDWELEEKVVTHLERHISKSASVRRNVHLPVLKSDSGRTRQCDIVIVEGNEPRKTVSIVEVQKRQSKPDINEFNGWVEKMREVGAQHLICVSQSGFPSSIEEKADEIGPTVRLLTLRQLEEQDWPIPSAYFRQELEVVRYDKLLKLTMEGEHVFRVDPRNPNPKEFPDPHRKIFRLKDGRHVSATDMVDFHLFSSPKNVAELPKNQSITLGIKFSWGWNKGPQYQDFGGTWVFLKSLLVHIKIYIRTEPLTWDVLVYEQRNWGETAWVLRGRSTLDGESVDLVTPLKRVAPGQYRLGTPVVLGDLDVFLAVGETRVRVQQFRD